jgi:hypothetical protein
VAGSDDLPEECITLKLEQPDMRGTMNEQVETPSFPFQLNNSIVAHQRQKIQDSLDMDATDPWRRGRGYLSDDIERVAKTYMGGELSSKYTPLTPFKAAKALVEIDQLDREDQPSHGAVQQIFKRWEREGRAYFMNDPYAFIAFKEETHD